MAPNFRDAGQKEHFDMGTMNEVLNRRDVRKMREDLRDFDRDLAGRQGLPGVQRAHANDIRQQIVRVRTERVALSGLVVAAVAAAVGIANAVVAITKNTPAPPSVVTVVVKQPVPVSGGVRIRGRVATK